MIKKNIFVFIFLTLNFQSQDVFCAAGGTPLEYLSIFTANAGASGTGNAFTAKYGEPSSPYWNPAGLSTLYYTSLSVMSGILFMGTQYAFFGMGYPLGEKGVFGVGIYRISSGYATRTDSIGRETGIFQEVSSCVSMTFSKKLAEKYGAGINLKIIDQVLGEWSARGYALDLGFLYLVDESGSLGISLQNFPYAWLGTEKAGMNLKVGFQKDILYKRLNFIADVYVLDLPARFVFMWASGIEMLILTPVKVRFGINTREVTAGFGFSSEDISFDYAAGVHPVDITHKIGVSVKYGYREAEYKKRLEQEKQLLKKDLEKASAEIEIKEEEIKKKKSELQLIEWINTKMLIATDYFTQGKYENAAKLLERVLNKDPQNENAKELLAEIKKKTEKKYAGEFYARAFDDYKKRDFADAVSNAEKAILLDSNHKGAIEILFLSKAQIFAKEGKYNEAKTELFELLKINPENKEGIELLKRVQTLIEVTGTNER
ncbi:MAG: hypothetical protein AB1633_01045 [Elusimicrobiota bacterium]